MKIYNQLCNKQTNKQKIILKIKINKQHLFFHDYVFAVVILHVSPPIITRQSSIPTLCRELYAILSIVLCNESI